MPLPISLGSGAASVASEKIGNNDYQQIKVVGAETGSTSVMGVNPDRSISVSVIGVPQVNVSGSVFATLSGSGSIVTVSKDSSILAVPVGSVITVWQNSSVLAVPVGSVITVWQNPSIAGTYFDGAAHGSGATGLGVLAVRNDDMTSVTSTSNVYSHISVGPSGEVISVNAPLTKWVRGTADLRVVLGASVTAIPAQGASVFTYITGVQVANFGSASVLVTLAGGLGSILGYTIAPAGGGSNIVYPNALKTGENSAFTASINGTASVLVSAQGFIAGI